MGDDGAAAGPAIYLNAIQIDPPAGHRTPIRVTLTVPNNCYRFMGGTVYSKGHGVVLDLSVYEGMHYGYRCAGPARITDVVAYPFTMHRGRAYRVQVVVNGRKIGDMTVVAGAAYQPGTNMSPYEEPNDWRSTPSGKDRDEDDQREEREHRRTHSFYGGG